MKKGDVFLKRLSIPPKKQPWSRVLHECELRSVKVLPPSRGLAVVAAFVTMNSAAEAKWIMDNVSGQVPSGLQTPVEIVMASPKGSKGMKGMMMATPMTLDDGKGGMQNNFGGVHSVPDLNAVVPATPLEVEQFLQLHPVEEHAQQMFRSMDPRGQRFVINRGPMSGARDATAAFIGRMKSVHTIISGGAVISPGDWICPSCGDTNFSRNTICRKCGQEKPESSAGHLKHTVPATPVEVEQFLVLNPVEQHAADKFRKMDAKAQRLVINKGGLEGARDATAAFIGRLSAVDKIARGTVVLPPGDWICPGCGDHQFARNESCRRCATPKPPGAGSEAAAPAGGMDPMQAAMAQGMLGMTPEMQMQMLMAQQMAGATAMTPDMEMQMLMAQMPMA